MRRNGKFSFFTLLIPFNMKSYSKFKIIILLAMMLLSCKSQKENQKINPPVMITGPNVIIYKTKGDYFMHVPVNLSDDKTTLTSYPAPRDVYYNGDLAYPVKLEDGYLLDRRGISPNSAFLKWTYFEYSRLEKSPTTTQLLNMLLDSDPFIAIYDCGKTNRFNNLEDELNLIIRTNKLSEFKRLK